MRLFHHELLTEGVSLQECIKCAYCIVYSIMAEKKRSESA